MSPAPCQQLSYLLYPQHGGHPRAEPRSEQPGAADARQAELACKQLLAALRAWIDQHPECLSGGRAKPGIRIRAEYSLELQLLNLSPELLESLRSALDSAIDDGGMRGMLSVCRGRSGFRPPSATF
ncbi:hypothetical protein IT575_13820 [bacterium]|nr:hypothetical protein [bacterium]